MRHVKRSTERSIRRHVKNEWLSCMMRNYLNNLRHWKIVQFALCVYHYLKVEGDIRHVVVKLYAVSLPSLGNSKPMKLFSVRNIFFQRIPVLVPTFRPTENYSKPWRIELGMSTLKSPIICIFINKYVSLG